MASRLDHLSCIQIKLITLFKLDRLSMNLFSPAVALYFGSIAVGEPVDPERITDVISNHKYKKNRYFIIPIKKKESTLKKKGFPHILRILCGASLTTTIGAIKTRFC